MSQMTDYWTKRRQASIPQGVGNVTPFFIAGSEGALVTDVDGRELIDFAGGIGALNIGHRHPAVVAAIKDQVDRYMHSCFHVMMYEPYVELAEQLNQIIPCRGERKTMLANSGAEAVENAVKIARYHTGRRGVVSFSNAFHGRTLLTMALTSKIRPYRYKLGTDTVGGIYRAQYPYCYRCPWGLSYPQCNLACGEDYFETDFFKRYVDPDEIAAIIIEPVQGEGGFIHPPLEYLPQLRTVCDRHGIVLIIDEVQTGFGRTGQMFASQHYGVEADIITTGKSLAGGMPLSAVTGTAEIMDSVHPGGLGGTYGGNPLACRAALAVLESMAAENLVEQGAALGERVRAAFDALADKHALIGQVRGLGAMLALELVKDRATKEPAAEETKALVSKCHDKGLLIIDCGTLGNNIRCLMPLNITDDQLERGLEIIDQSLTELED